MTIVLDTNVLVSALLNPHGIPAKVLRAVLVGRVQLAYDFRILSEYREVLRRPKFPFGDDQIGTLLDLFEKEGVCVTAAPLGRALPDTDDAPFLEVAVAGKVDALVTGNPRHFPEDVTAPVAVLSPRELLARLRV
ncbi:MAG TPA: putative toxin-antitoxin system toxin component, PIN family [bacterium]|jgi:putative PIN family toxin of toxin-antitoxin system